MAVLSIQEEFFSVYHHLDVHILVNERRRRNESSSAIMAESLSKQCGLNSSWLQDKAHSDNLSIS